LEVVFFLGGSFFLGGQFFLGGGLWILSVQLNKPRLVVQVVTTKKDTTHNVQLDLKVRLG